MSRQRGFLILGLCLLGGWLAAPASAAVLFSDSFNRVEGSSDTNGKPADPSNFSAWGTNDNALGGSNTAAWIVGPDRGGGANGATDGSVASTIEGLARTTYDAVADAPNGFSVAFDFNRFHPLNPGTGNGFLSVALGFDPTANPFGSAANTGNSQFALLFQQAAGGNTGNTQIFEDGAFTAGTSAGGVGPIDYGDPTATHSVLMTFIPAVPGAYGDSDTINASVSIDGSTPYAFSVLGGANFGTVSFSSNGFVHRMYDNVVISSVPEPTTVLLSSLAALAFVCVRCRRR